MPVLEEHEWGDPEVGENTPDNEEHEDLDEKNGESSTETGEQDL